MVGALRRPARDPALSRARRRPLRPAPRPAARHARRRGRVRRVSGALVGRLRRRRAVLCDVPDHGDGMPLGAAHPRHPGARALRGRGASHRPLAARRRRRRGQARRRDRHGLVRGAGHPGDRRAGRARDGVPADGQLQRARLERAARGRCDRAAQGPLRRAAPPGAHHDRRQPVERALAERLGRDARGARGRVRGALCRRRVLPPLGLPRPLRGSRGQRAARGVPAPQDPRARARSRGRRAPVPLRPSRRRQADVRRHRLLRDLQPAERAPGLDPRASDRRDHGAGAARRRRGIRVRHDRARNRLRCDDRARSRRSTCAAGAGARCARSGRTGRARRWGSRSRASRTSSRSPARAARRCSAT